MDSARLAVFMLGVALAAAPGCGGWARDSETRAARTWIRRMPTDVDWGPPLDRSRYEFVDDQKRTDAVSLLADRPWAELTVEQATVLVSGAVATPTGGRPFLLRALHASGGKSGIRVYQRHGGEVSTRAGTLSPSGTVPILRWPVVAWLDQQPVSVYPTFSVAR